MKRSGLIGAVSAFLLSISPLSESQAQQNTNKHTEISLDQARNVAATALNLGEFELARKLAMGLLLADEEDAFAYSILTTAHSKLGNPKLARAAARLTYKYSNTKLESYSAARSAGQVAFQQKRYTASQIWLRRASVYAPDDRYTRRIAKDYAQVRAVNPLSFRLNVAVTPSDNVNNGADSLENLVNGEPQLGFINAASRALSGVIATTDASLSYRIRQTKTSRTLINARLFTRNVFLSSDAKALIAADPFSPDLDDSDFSTIYYDGGVSHSFALGKKPGAFARIDATAGKTISAGRSNYKFGRLAFTPSYALNKSTRLTLRGSVEQRYSDIVSLNDQTRFQTSATLRKKRANGDTVSFGLNLQDTNSDGRNISNWSGVADLNYSFGKQIGPMQLSAGLSLGYTHFSTYSTTSPVVGGRSDTSVYGNLTMFFVDYDLAGFSPTVRVRTGRRTSNVSRFETEEFSVSLGIQSKF